jgi:NodT family efflux transporter outer membrane factor (OMF) lipoprotein
MLRTRYLAPALALLALGCKVGPDYTAPRVDTGRGWAQPADPGAPQLDRWWRLFNDPTLDRLEQAALGGNLDLRQAQARIREARALREAAAGGRWPALDARGSVTREQQTLDGPLPIQKIPGLARDITVYDAEFDATWELDLFGGVRRQVESAQAQAQAAVEQARDARVSVAAEVARTYLTLRGAQLELEARGQGVEALRRILETTRTRAAAGDVAQVEVDQAQAQYQDAAAALPGLRAQARAAALGLGALLGGLPESEAGLADTPPTHWTLAPIPVGARADLLRRRPDVRAAERQLAAATAQVGVARAEWFPKLSIGASAGYQALQSSQLFTQPSQMLSVGPLISWRIFQGGAIKAEIHAAEARQEQAALGYEKAVLGALADAERALVTYRLALDTVRAQDDLLATCRRSYRHAERRHRAGDIALAELLQAEGRVRDAEDAQARARTGAAIDLAALCKALGGGWPAGQEPVHGHPGVAGLGPEG